MTRLVHLNDNVKHILTANNKYRGLPYMMVYYLLKSQTVPVKVSDIKLCEMCIILLMELTCSHILPRMMNEPVNESIIIPHIPVVAGSSYDMIVVASCYLLGERERHMVPFYLHLIGLIKNW